MKIFTDNFQIGKKRKKTTRTLMHAFCQEAPGRYGLTKKGEQTTDEGKTASREQLTEHK